MNLILKNYLSYDAIYRSASILYKQYAALDLTYNPVCLRWPQVSEFVRRLIGSHDVSTMHKQYAALDLTYNPVCLRWPQVGDFAKRHTIHAWNSGKVFFWTYKEWVAGGLMLALGLGIAHYIWKNRPQAPITASSVTAAAPAAVSSPPPPPPAATAPTAPPPEPPVATSPPPAEPQLKVKLESSLNVAVLDIKGPEKQKYDPPKASLIFCIDISGSMGSENRLGAVKAALKEIVEHALGVVGAFREAKICLEIIVFDDKVEQFLDFTPFNSQTTRVEELKSKIELMNARGGTNILLGLGMACEKVRLDRASREGTPTVVLLTDGDETINKNLLSPIHTRLTDVNAKLFAIGIGSGHRKETLKTIINNQKDISTGSIGEYGEYRDASAGSDAISNAISEIYGRAIASFSQLELRATGLPAHSWSVVGASFSKETGVARYYLGHLSEGQTLARAIDIHWEHIRSILELKNVTFYLSFTNPKGERVEVSLAYNPDTSINGPLLQRAKTLGSIKL